MCKLLLSAQARHFSNLLDRMTIFNNLVDWTAADENLSNLTDRASLTAALASTVHAGVLFLIGSSSSRTLLTTTENF